MSEIKERPILFSGPMVRAILEGRKTMTRRVVRESFNGSMTFGGPHPCPNAPVFFEAGMIEPWPVWQFFCSSLDAYVKCPYGKPGDRLWVRETWSTDRHDWKAYAQAYTDEPWRGIPDRDNAGIFYREDGNGVHEGCGVRWKPSIFMPRWASRIMLEVVSVRVERVQEISGLHCVAEGIDMDGAPMMETRGECADWCRRKFHGLWDSINLDRGFGWSVNPWVWVIEFKRVTGGTA